VRGSNKGMGELQEHHYLCSYQIVLRSSNREDKIISTCSMHEWGEIFAKF
jgi:hypothetical protein